MTLGMALIAMLALAFFALLSDAPLMGERAHLKLRQSALQRGSDRQESEICGIMKFAWLRGLVMPQMRRRMWVFGAAVWGLVGALAVPSVGAADLTPKQAAQIQAVVQAQLKAFAADDAVLAFSYATPRIRKAFGNADMFLAMVRASYPMVYRPASVAFFKPEKLDGVWVQRAQMSDELGVLWQVTYALERQRNKSWRINGCEVAASEGRVA
jgi:hypothetical protein